MPPHGGQGLTNISGDIMLALPHYTQAEFDETLELIEDGGATHISAYLLKIEPDSAFGRHPPRVCPPAMKPPIFTFMPWSSWNTTATGSTRSPTLQSPGYEGSTTSSTGTAATIWALARRRTPAWAADGSTTRRTPPLSWTMPPPPSWTAAAVQRTTSFYSCVCARGCLDAYKKRYGKEFSTAQLAFVQNCVRAAMPTLTAAPLP